MLVRSKEECWPEIFEVASANSKTTIEKFIEVIARFGLPSTCVSDNGAPFTSQEFEDFCKNNGITHLTSSPFHPASNGAAENAVKTFKLAIKKIVNENNNFSMHTCLQKYLFAYGNSPHCTTGKKPSEVIFKGCVKT